MSGFVMSRPFNTLAGGLVLQLVYLLLLALLLTLGRAYQTGDMHMFVRFSLWLVVCSLIIFQARCLNARLLKLSWPSVLAWLTAILTTTAVLALQLDLLKYTPLLPKAHDPYLEFVLFLLPAVVLVASGSLLLDLIPLSTNLAEPAENSPVLVVQAQEHYLLLTTATGQQIRRARMQDLVAELSAVNGLQVHRSWWVNAEAVKKVTRDGRDYVLHLTTGGQVPVARSRVPVLREAGWV